MRKKWRSWKNWPAKRMDVKNSRKDAKIAKKKNKDALSA
jgi:hypothetical protein